MRMNIIMETPADLLIDDAWIIANPGAAYELSRVDAEWVHRIMPDSHEIAGKKILQISIDIDGDDPAGLVEALLTIYDLPWTLKGMQTFYNQKLGLDAEDNLIYGPIVYKTVDPSVLDYLPDRPIYDAENNVIGQQVKELNMISNWQGAADWK